MSHAERLGDAEAGHLTSLTGLPNLIDGESLSDHGTATRAEEWKTRVVAFMKKPLVLVAVTWMVIAFLLAQELLNK